MRHAMSNAIAQRYYMHSNDTDDATGRRACYFAQTDDEDGWGFWVDSNGGVTIDGISANGEMPADSTVRACVRSARKALLDKALS